MSDQAEKIILEAEDRVTPEIAKANAGLESFEKKAGATHSNVVRITDQTLSSVKRLTASLEKQAEIYGKSGVERLVSQRDQLLQRYAKEPTAIDAITKSYEKMIAVEQKAASEGAAAKAAKEAEEALRKHSEAIKSYGERVTQFMENPIQGARGAMGSLLTTMGPFGVGVAAGATALIGFAAAGFEAAKSLGEYGTQIKDAELRTGLTAKEVGQFGFAAKAVGQDISVVERLMRGLSQAADDNSAQGEKARATMLRMGVDLHTAAGELKPTSEVLTELAEGLNRLPAGLQRDAAAMDLFKRAGIEAIPFMTELNENLRIAHEQGFGPTEADVLRFQEYQREVTVLETKWEAIKRSFKEGLVVEVSFVGSAAKWLWGHMPGETVGGDQASIERMNQKDALAGEIRQANAAKFGPYAAPNAIAAMQRRRMEALRGLEPEDAWRGPIESGGRDYRSPDAIRKMADAEQWRERIAAEQKRLAEEPQVARARDLQAGKEESDRLRARFFGTHEGMEKAYSDAKKDVEKYRKDLFEPEHPLTKTEVTELGGKLHTAQGTEARWKTALDAEKNQTEGMAAFRRAAAEFEKKGDEAELSAIEKIYYQRDLLLQQAAKVKAVEADIAGIRKSADEQASVITKKATEDFDKYDRQRQADQTKKTMGMFLPSKEQLKDWDEVFKAQERIDDIGLDTQRNVLRRHAAGQAKAAKTPEDAYQVRVDLALQLAQIEIERVQREDTAGRKMILAAEAQKQLYTDLATAQDDLDEKRAAAEQKRTEELQKQVDQIEKVSSGLLHTLFTKPGDFPKQLSGTIREAALKPIEEGFGGMIAHAVHPAIYGENGQGGLAGIFHGAFGGGNHDPITVTVDNTTATRRNSETIAALTAVLAAYMGVPAPAVAGTVASVTGITVPSIPALAPGGGWSSAGGAAMSGAALAGGFSPAAWSSRGASQCSLCLFWP